MENIIEKYRPVDCGFYDHLEHFATLREKIDVVYKENDRIKTIKEAIISDLSGGRNGEFVHLNRDEHIIRADFLISVGGINLDDFNHCFV